MDVLRDLATLKGGTYEVPRALGGAACLGRDGAVLGAYAPFDDEVAAFYTAAQAPQLRAEAERVVRERQARFEEERKRKGDCRADKTRILRAGPKLGMRTNYGMVVDVKPPLAQLQAPEPNGLVLQWVEIARLEPPYGEYCN